MQRKKPSLSKIPPVVSFVGRSGAGKTCFLERLIPALKSRGLRVGTIKHHAHPIGVDQPGKDTHRHLDSGADRVALAGPGQNAYFERIDGEAPPEAVIRRFFLGLDLVLTEGFKRGPFPKIEVARRAVSEDLICGPEEGLIAVVADFDPGRPQPRFSPEDGEGVADFLEALIMTDAEKPRWKVTLRVDGKEIPIKEFVEDVFINVSLGMVETLKNVSETPVSVEILLKRGE